MCMSVCKAISVYVCVCSCVSVSISMSECASQCEFACLRAQRVCVCVLCDILIGKLRRTHGTLVCVS